jgi:hypothetical protein
MSRKAWVVLVLCIAALTMLAIAASPAAAGAGGEAQVATPAVAYFHIEDGNWWSGGYGWYGSTNYDPGTPIPAQDFIMMYEAVEIPDRSLVEQMPQIFLLSLTVKAANGDVVVKTTEEQSAQFWGTVKWDPFASFAPVPSWGRHWQVPLGYLPPGTYHVTTYLHLTTRVEFTVPETGELIVLKPFRDSIKLSFIVQ